MNPSPSFPSAHLRKYLIAAYVLFIIYASLSPFSGWQEQGFKFSDVLAIPLWKQYSLFDVAANLLAYLPFGLLLGLTLHARFGTVATVIFATLIGMIFSAMMEYAQVYLPMRISSSLDIVSNSCGALLGALLAVSIAPQVWFAQHLSRWRMHLLHRGRKMDFGLALVALWMSAQVNPSLPMLGNVFINQIAQTPFAPAQPAPFNVMESAAVALNLLMLGMLLLTLLRNRHHTVSALLLALVLVALAKFVAAAVLLKSWALLLWLNSEAIFGIVAGVALLVAAVRLPRIWILKVAALVTVAYMIVANWILDGGPPAIALPPYQRNYGHQLNFNGLSQSITVILPFLILGYLWNIRRIRNGTGEAPS